MGDNAEISWESNARCRESLTGLIHQVVIADDQGIRKRPLIFYNMAW